MFDSLLSEAVYLKKIFGVVLSVLTIFIPHESILLIVGIYNVQFGYLVFLQNNSTSNCYALVITLFWTSWGHERCFINELMWLHCMNMLCFRYHAATDHPTVQITPEFHSRKPCILHISAVHNLTQSFQVMCSTTLEYPELNNDFLKLNFNGCVQFSFIT